MTNPVIQTSFASGELSPTLFARVDINKYSIGAARLRNMFVDYTGGAKNRPGTRFIGRCKDSTTNIRVIPFQFSTIQSYILEFGNLYMRVIKDDAYVTETGKTITGITQANPAVVTSTAHGFANNDWVFISGVVGMTQVNGRFFIAAGVTADTFQLQTLAGVNVNSTGYTAYSSAGTAARIYTLVTPYASADLPTLKFAQSADVMTITHNNYAPRDLTRTAHAAWTLSVIAFAANIATPTGLTGANSAPGASPTTRYGYTVTAINKDGEEGLPSNETVIQGADPFVTASTIRVSWDSVANAESYNIYRTSRLSTAFSFATTFDTSGPSFKYIGTSRSRSFEDGAIVADVTKSPPAHRNPFAVLTVLSLTISSGGTTYSADTTVTITDPTGTGVVLKPIIEGGVIIDIVVVRGGENYTSPTVVIAGTTGSGAAATANIGPGTGTYPAVVSYFQQRKIFAASANYPQTFWMTRIKAYNNMDVSNPSNAADAITGTIVSNQVNAIKHLIEMPGGLLALTTNRVFQISGADGVISPATTQISSQAFKGSADTRPLVVNYDILYVQDKGSTVIDMVYNFGSNIYQTQDISVLSNHLFLTYTLSNWAYAEVPYKIVWAVRSDGKALSLTFLKEHEVVGWTWNDTQGLFKDVAVISVGGEDAVYFVVQRIIGGSSVQYIEKLGSRELRGHIENSWFLDSALQTTLTYPAATLTPAAASGTNVAFVASASVFVSGDVGRVIRVGGGVATVTAFDSGTQVRGDFTTTISQTFPSGAPIPQISGAWSIASKTSSVSGLEHLEGQTVSVFGDGVELTSQTVANGAVAVSTASSLVLVGLPFTSQLQTLPLDTGQPTIQGKRKQIFGMTARVVDSAGFKVGATFATADLQAWSPNAHNFAGTLSNGLRTGDYRRNVAEGWNVPGQACFQQDRPLPLSILGVIPEIYVGDTARAQLPVDSDDLARLLAVPQTVVETSSQSRPSQSDGLSEQITPYNVIMSTNQQTQPTRSDDLAEQLSVPRFAVTNQQTRPMQSDGLSTQLTPTNVVVSTNRQTQPSRSDDLAEQLTTPRVVVNTERRPSAEDRQRTAQSVRGLLNKSMFDDYT